MSLRLADYFAEPPHVEVKNGRSYAFARLTIEYAGRLERLALAKEDLVKTLPVSADWESEAEKNPTTARYQSYSAFLLSPITLPLFFAIRETYLHLLRALDQQPVPRFIQCWYNIHRVGEALSRHGHAFPFIGTFSAHALDSVTRYGATRETSESDLIVTHAIGQLMVTTGPDHYHQTSV